jgi:drug/metabolite transporter (DMT)-like permease
VGKFLLDVFSGTQLAGLLYLGAALGVSIPVAKAHRKGKGVPLDRRNLFLLAGAILFGGILGPLFLLAGLRLASAASVSLWLNLEFVATLLLGHLFFKDHLGRHGWLGAALVGGASLSLSLDGNTAPWQAGAFIVLACLCWGLDNHLTALIDGILPTESTFWKGLAAGGTNLTLGLVIADYQASAAFTVLALATGALAYGASIVLYITSAQALGAVRSQMVFASAPFFGLTLSWALLGERLTLIQGMAATLQALGISLLFRDRHAHSHVHEAMEHTHLHAHDDGHHAHGHPGLDPHVRHSHPHGHEPTVHAHPHWPDLHHRHKH